MQKNSYITVLLLVLVMFVLSAVDIFSAGTQEDKLSLAEQLVEQREYNEAIKVLTEALKEEPSRMDDIQALLTKIRIEKENYNNKYEDLIVVYGGDDLEAAYPLIEELQTMDPNPNEATRTSLVLARETAGFVFNNNRWLRIMDEASEQLSREAYSDSVETYMTGFDLSRVIFQDSGYGNIIVNEVFDRADQMNEDSLEFVNLYPAMQDVRDRIDNSFAGRALDNYITAINEMYPDLRRAAELRESLKDLADYFIVQEENIRKAAGNDKQVHYLIYMDRLLNGRTTIDEQEGITGAIELYWNNIYEDIIAGTAEYSEELFSKVTQQYNERAYQDALGSVDDTLDLLRSSIAAYTFGSQYFESDAQFLRPGILAADVDKFDSILAYLETALNVAEEFPVMIEKQTLIAGLVKKVNDINNDYQNSGIDGAQLKTDIANERVEINSYISEWEQALGSIDSGDEGSPEGKSIAAVTIAVEEYTKMQEKLLTEAINLTAILAGAELARLEGDYESIKTLVDQSSDLISGIPSEDDNKVLNSENEVEYEVLYKYPDKALNQLLSVQGRVDSLVSGVTSAEQKIINEEPVIVQSQQVQTVSDGLSGLMIKSRSILSLSNSLMESAREQIFTAEKLKQEGEKRIEDSKLLTQKASFAAAKERLEQAASKFDESLLYLEDPLLRTYRDNEIPRLYDEIQVAENNLVVKQVREYLNQGKANYSQGKFAAAQNVLIKAQNRWSDTNVELNPEVEYWLTLTQTALTVTSGRVIAATDPLYTEMNQFLNQAREDFQLARNEYERNMLSSAEGYFASAEQSILYVQQFFPFNEEARVLNLRISQYRNPEQFDEIFGNDFRAAKKLISTNPQKAYIDLKDLEAIKPDYPGLQAAITEAEYATGIKVRPPDRQKLTRSDELYKLAYDIVSRNVRSEFNVALEYLNEAINLNPDNNDAIRLKDRISTDVGGTATVVMSSTDQQLYNEAVSEFTSGNYLKARIIVESLLQNPENQRNPKLLDLKERIDRTR